MIPQVFIPPLLQLPDEEDLHKFLNLQSFAILELQQILQGNTVLASLEEDAEDAANCSAAIVEAIWATGDSSQKVVNNPLGRPLRGAVCIGWAGSQPDIYSLSSTFGVTANSTTVTWASSISSLIGGFFIGTGGSVPYTRYSISSQSTGVSFELDHPWEGSTASITGLVVFPLGPDYIYISVASTLNGAWCRWLVF